MPHARSGNDACLMLHATRIATFTHFLEYRDKIMYRMKVDDPISNIKFIKVVKKHSCLWNFMLPDYSRREITERAWNEVAEEMGDTVSNCRERWRNIRGGFVRSKRQPSTADFRAKSKKQPYYLTKYLQFLTPFTRHRKMNFNMSSLTEAEIEEVNDDKSNDSTQSENCNSNESSPKSPFKWTNDETVETNFLQTDGMKSQEICANQSFLNSLLPDMNEMTSKQNRRFRQKVIGLIDEILDDADMRRHSSEFMLGQLSPMASQILAHQTFKTE